MSRTKNGDSASKVKTTPIAIIGMGSIFPKALTTQEYWDNILHKIDCIMDVPESRWKIEDYYDPNPNTPDKTYCKRGAFIPDVPFDPLEFGLPPNILEVTDVSQLLSLVVARDALEDAGYGEDRKFDRELVGVVLGVVGMSSKIFTPLMTRLQYPVWEKALVSSGIAPEDSKQIVEKMKLAYIGWEENAFPGAIGNVIAGRICNRFDLGGMNCVVDAACASSLAAVKMAVGELIEGRADMMITGGVDADNTINSYMCFSKTPAFSKGEHVRTFDAESDGMMVGEGLGMVVLKRLEDAERDGDKIYAVIKAVGTSSDGRFKSIYAPRPDGQAKAVRRAYAEAGFSPHTVGLIEAHGTGTMAGDPSEFQGINQVFGEDNPRKQYIALGSVKSQIAHTKAAAGVASLMKTALALYHKVLPPTINVTRPNPKFGIENTPFYINTETRPWIRAASAAPRRAGVSSFGFGGTNFHVVLEEGQAEHVGAYRVNRGAQAILLTAPDATQLLTVCKQELQALGSETGGVRFAELTLASRTMEVPVGAARVGFVSENVEEARQALQVCVDTLAEKGSATSWEHPKGIYYRKSGIDTQGKVVALFSGQGSQYLEMGRELAVNFPMMRKVFGALDELFLQDGLEPLSARVYPKPVFDSKEREGLGEMLTRTDHAQPAIGAFSASLYQLLQAAGFQADFVAGHSFGELTALWAGGVLSDADYYTLAKARGKAMAPPSDPNFDAGTMMAVKGDVEKVRALFANDAEVTLANYNANNQVVIAGSKAAMARAKQTLEAQGFQAIPLPVSAAFHTPLVEHAQKPFAKAIAAVKFNKPAIKVYANGTGQAHPADAEAIRKALAGHILNPVLFRDEIQNIYAEGGRIFVEFGPKNILTNLVGNILEGKEYVAVALNANAKKDSDRQLREAVVALRVAGVMLKDFDPFARPLSTKVPRKQSAVTVMLNGGYYMTEKTRAAYDNAIKNGFRIATPAASANGGNGKSHEVTALAAQPTAAPAPAAVQAAPVQQPGVDLSVVENLLAEYQGHQAETLRLHEQYLRTEEEYARAFAQLTQLQTELVSKGSSAPGELQAVIPLFESLERSMTRFHEHQAETLRVHQHYLETQERFSQTFVQGVTGAAVAGPSMAASQPAATSLKPAAPAGNGNGYAKPVSAAPVVKPVPVPMAATTAVAVPAPVAAPTAVQAVAIDIEKLTQAMLVIVSDKTGYPVETLELDMDMEADLGIDSIKRVEILGAMQTQFPALPKVEATELAELRTLGQIVSKLGQGVAANAVVAAPAAAAVAEPVAAAPAAVAAGVSAGVAGKPAVSTEQVAQALLSVVSDKTGYPVETLELDMNMEADLGIDSIKRVEILGTMQTQFPELPKPDATVLAELCTLRQVIEYLAAGIPASAGVRAVTVTPVAVVEPVAAVVLETAVPASNGGLVNAEAVAEALMAVVSDKTGYPVETLEPDMDMEADLGIDSIKRVEILGTMQTQFPELPKPDANALAELRTMRQIVAYLSAPNGAVAAPAVNEIVVSQAEQPPFDPGIEQGFVARKVLPPPDALAFQLPAGHVCLMTDDGTPLAVELAQVLAERGWPLVVLQLPTATGAARRAFPANVIVYALDDFSEASLQARLDEIAGKYGPAAVFLHLASSDGITETQTLAFPEMEKALLKLVFLAAKHLKPALNEAAAQGRAAFVTVTRMDGEFGLGSGSYTPVNGGLFGLVKTLNLEWDQVFCRAIDLSPALEVKYAAACIVAELHDPNRLLIEAGYNADKERSTLTITPIAVTGEKK